MVDVVELIKKLIGDLMGNPDAAAQFAADPYGVVAAQGITDQDLTGVDAYQLAGEVCTTGAVPESARTAWQGYSSGGSSGGSPSGGYTPAPSGPAPATHSVEHVVQQLQTVTYVTYQDDHSITQTILDNSVDNSVDVDISDVHGDVDLDLDVDNATAVGDGSVATSGSGNDVNAATGDQAQVIDGDNYGQANTGDGAVQAGDDIDAPVVTGGNTGIVADGDVNNAAVGTEGPVTQVQNTGDEAQFGFGDGDLTNQDTTISDSTLVNSTVGTEQGEGDLDQEAEIEIDLGRSGHDGHDPVAHDPVAQTHDVPGEVFAPAGSESDHPSESSQDVEDLG